MQKQLEIKTRPIKQALADNLNNRNDGVFADGTDYSDSTYTHVRIYDARMSQGKMMVKTQNGWINPTRVYTETSTPINYWQPGI